jgi:chromatin segregation and condensation protein Rec8/ScpA/Scc1 (kleisin family)
MFAASLEMVKEGRILIRQSDTFGDIYLQRRMDGPTEVVDNPLDGDPDDNEDQ